MLYIYIYNFPFVHPIYILRSISLFLRRRPRRHRQNFFQKILFGFLLGSQHQRWWGHRQVRVSQFTKTLNAWYRSITTFFQAVSIMFFHVCDSLYIYACLFLWFSLALASLWWIWRTTWLPSKRKCSMFRNALRNFMAIRMIAAKGTVLTCKGCINRIYTVLFCRFCWTIM